MTPRIRVLSLVSALILSLPGLCGATQVSFYATARLLAADGALFDAFGSAVGASGDTVVVGAGRDDDLGSNSGSVHIFERDAEGAWVSVAKLIPADGGAGDHFGVAAGLSGDTLVAGAEGKRAAYVYRRDAEGGWGQEAQFSAPEPLFGVSAAISGNTVVIGAAGDEATEGSAYFFQRDSDGAWGQVARVVAADGAPGNGFGNSVAISGETAVIGASFDADRGEDSGSAYVFQRNAEGAWAQAAKLNAADGRAFDYFGISAGISGDTAVVGAFRDDDLGFASGAAFVFERDAGGPGAWGQAAKLLAADGAANDDFGVSVAISGATALIGAYGDDDRGSSSGSSYVFQRDAGGAWGQVAKLTAADGRFFDLFGSAVAISGGTLVVAAVEDDDQGSASGSAYIFLETLVDPTLSLTGSCPGETTIAAAGLTPLGQLALYGAPATGSSELPGGACVGTQLGLGEPRRLGVRRADEAGALAATLAVPDSACGTYVQVVDATSCATSGVVQVP